MTQLIGIVAMTPDRIIGRDGGLPWHLPEDLAFFKKTTSGFPIVMGRKTFESIGRPLPKRRNIVLTRATTWSADGIEILHKLSDLNDLVKDEEKVFIIGGAEIYNMLLNQMDELIITHVKHAHDGDTKFPDITPLFTEQEILLETNEFTVKRYLAHSP